jgi:TonB-linked SusC/RagA family outer membrane protein
LLFLVFAANQRAHAEKFSPGPLKDSVPTKTVEKIRITVKDIADGSVIDSAHVSIGSKSGITNADGVVEMQKLSGNSVVVVISKKGYYSVSKKTKSDVQIRMTKVATNNGPTVNNGMYERPDEHFSGAATVISGNQLRQVNSINFVDALGYYDPAVLTFRNNLNGDNPNSKSSVKIRGRYNFPASASIASQNGSAGVQLSPSSADYIADNIANPDQPVVFLDGIQVSLQTALDLDINLIDKVTVLKDAAATTAYGVRGGNGVLLVQTRLPKEGPLRINYSGQIQVSDADLSSYHLLNAPDKLAFEKNAGMYTSSDPLYQMRNNGINTDWLQVPLRTAISNKHTLRMEMGEDGTSYGLNFSYNNMQGVMKGSGRQIADFEGYFGRRIGNFFFSNRLGYQSAVTNNSPYGSFDAFARLNPYWSPYDSVTGKMRKYLEDTLSGAPANIYNPGYNGSLSTTDKTTYSRLYDQATFDVQLRGGFKINGLIGLGKQSDQQDYFLPPSHTAFANYTPDNFFKRGLYNQTLNSFANIEGRLTVNYDKRFGLHQLYASAGAGALQTQSEASGISVMGFSSDKMSDLAFGSGYSNTRPSTGKIVTRLATSFANVTYSFDNRYQLDITGNADASSQFGSEQNYATHWSGGLSWNLHQEHFFHANNILNQFRLRASVGTAGSLFYPSYLGQTSFNYYTDKQYIQGGSGLNTRGIGLGAYLTSFGNNQLQAPVTLKKNAGLDAVLFKNRLSIRVDAFDQKTDNLVLPVVSPASTGFLNYAYYDNLGSIETKGLEFAVNYMVLYNKSKAIAWNIMLNGIHSEDKILSTSSYVDAVTNANDQMTVDQTRPQPRYVAGQSLTGIWAVKSLGIDPATGQEKFQKADGTTTNTWSSADKILAGDFTPKWQGTFGTAVTVKGLTAGVYFRYQLGGQLYNQTLADKIENADLKNNVDERALTNRWAKPGDIATFKPVYLNGLVTSPTYATTRFVEKNDLINCSSASLGYMLPSNWSSKIKAQQVNLRLMGEGLFHTGGVDMERGIYYPFQRRYSFIINTTF